MAKAGRKQTVVPLKPYGIGVAARLAGIEPETLRIWERRYQLLSPGRTEGGHRLYSESDVEVLRAAKKLTEAGMRISQVAGLPPAEIVARAAQVPEPRRPSALDETAALIDEILDAARALDTARAAALLDRPRLLADGRAVMHAVYLPVLRKAGDLWSSGTLTVAAEHFLEKLVTSRMHAIYNAIPDGSGGRLALIACPPGERHEGGAIAAAVELRATGFSVVLLGADTPIRDLRGALERLAPDVLVLAVTNTPAAAAQRELVALLAEPGHASLPIFVGGLSAAPLATALRPPVHVIDAIDAIGAAARRVAR